MKDDTFSHMLDIFVSYYHTTRGVGHTKLLIDAINNFNGSVLVVVPSMAIFNKSILPNIEDKNKAIPIDCTSDDFRHRIAGYALPIIFDNSALFYILEDMRVKMARHENKLRKLKDQSISLNKILEEE